MISSLVPLIRSHPKWLRSAGASLSFLKFSTPTSGREGKDGKVMLFVFEERETTPTLCVKTVRDYALAPLIRHHHEQLTFLKASAEGSEDTALFSQPLYLHDDQAVIFSVESVSPGRAFSVSGGDVSLVVRQYTDWQKIVAKNNTSFISITDIDRLIRRAIRELELEGESAHFLEDFFQQLPLDTDLKLPALLQHGDMSPDNVLLDGKTVQLIDYDYVGISTLPGFDLFNFLAKSPRRTSSLRALCDRYLPFYYRSLGVSVEKYDRILFACYLQELVRKKARMRGRSGEQIIADFNLLMKS